ncbi:hypothetical protein JCM16418A_36240 [Paenibacillus pini]
MKPGNRFECTAEAVFSNVMVLIPTTPRRFGGWEMRRQRLLDKSSPFCFYKQRGLFCVRSEVVSEGGTSG